MGVGHWALALAGRGRSVLTAEGRWEMSLTVYFLCLHMLGVGVWKKVEY